MKCDVLVVGAGPAGVVAAYTIAKSGKNVILIDEKKQSEIGDKVCGDALRIEHAQYVQDKIGLFKPQKNEINDIIDYFVIKTLNHELEFDLPNLMIVIDRKKYGQRILNETERIGVQILPEKTIEKIEVIKQNIVGSVIVDKKTKEKILLNCKIIIDCTGRNSAVRSKLLQRDFPNLELKHEKDEFAVAYREIIKLKNKKNPFKSKLVVIYDKSVPEPGYFWIFSKGPEMVNVGVGWKQTKNPNVHSVKKVFKETLHKYFTENDYDVLHNSGYTIPARYPLLNAVGNGFLTAGDAAFHVDPYTAEGHGPALLSGYLAGHHAVKALNKSDVSEEGLWGYNHAVMELFGRTHLKSYFFVKMLTDLGMQEFFDFMLAKKIITLDEFRNIRHGIKIKRIDMIIKIIKMSKRMRYIIRLYQFSRHLKTINKFIEKYPVSSSEYLSWYHEILEWIENKGR